MRITAAAAELELVRPAPDEVHLLREVYHGLIDPVFSKLEGISGDKTIQTCAAKRLMFYVATLVEGARDCILQAQKQGQSLEFKGIHDLNKLGVYLSEDSKYDDVRKQLAFVILNSKQSPLDAMNALGLSIDAGTTSIDGKIVFGFSPQERVEYGAIYMDANVNPDAPTAKHTTTPFMPTR